MQTLYACKDFSAYLVESKHTGQEASTSLAGAISLARDSSHASTRSRTRWWRLIVVAGFLASPKSGVVSQCSAATPYTQTSPGPRGQRLGVSSRELLPKLERLQRRAGRTQPFCIWDRQRNRGWLSAQGGIILHATADRQAGQMRRQKANVVLC